MQDTVNIDTFDFVYNFFNINSRKFYRRYKDAAQIHTQQVINTEYIAHIIYIFYNNGSSHPLIHSQNLIYFMKLITLNRTPNCYENCIIKIHQFKNIKKTVWKSL